MKKILEEYDKKGPLLKKFQEKMESLLNEVVPKQKIRIFLISSRVKDRDSLIVKILKKQAYSKLNDITDVVGCRIITYFNDEVDKVVRIINKEFDVDKENTVDKRKLEYDKFGYSSYHFVVMLKKTRLKLIEFKEFKNLKFEIQVRTILQHSWAEIEHDIGYKSQISVPDDSKRRMFSRIAALLEVADIEFVNLRNDLNRYKNSIDKKIITIPEKVSLNKASLLSFIHNNIIMEKTEKEIADHFKFQILQEKDEAILFDTLIRLINFSGIYSMKDLESEYLLNCVEIVRFSKIWRNLLFQSKKSSKIEPLYMLNGFSLYDLALYKIRSSKQENEINLFFSNYLEGLSKESIIKSKEAFLKLKNE